MPERLRKYSLNQALLTYGKNENCMAWLFAWLGFMAFGFVWFGFMEYQQLWVIQCQMHNFEYILNIYDS